MLLTVYLKSNEITFEVKRPQKLPALESREKNSSKNSIGEYSLLKTNIVLFTTNAFYHCEHSKKTATYYYRIEK